MRQLPQCIYNLKLFMLLTLQKLLLYQILIYQTFKASVVNESVILYCIYFVSILATTMRCENILKSYTINKIYEFSIKSYCGTIQSTKTDILDKVCAKKKQKRARMCRRSLKTFVLSYLLQKEIKCHKLLRRDNGFSENHDSNFASIGLTKP
jgi:hypothetical protein